VISIVNAGLLTSLPGRYAKALFQVGQTDKQTERLAKGLKALIQLYQGNDLFRKTLLNDFLSILQKIAIWREVARKLSLSEELQQFVIVLLKGGRLPLLLSIAKIYEELIATAKGIVRVEIKSASWLSSQQKEDLEAFLKERYAKRIEATYDLEPEIMSGIYVQCGSEVIDATLRGQLARLTKSLEGEA